MSENKENNNLSKYLSKYFPEVLIEIIEDYVHNPMIGRIAYGMKDNEIWGVIISEEKKCYRLHNRRIVKKQTENKKWAADRHYVMDDISESSEGLPPNSLFRKDYEKITNVNYDEVLICRDDQYALALAMEYSEPPTIDYVDIKYKDHYNIDYDHCDCGYVESWSISVDYKQYKIDMALNILSSKKTDLEKLKFIEKILE